MVRAFAVVLTSTALIMLMASCGGASFEGGGGGSGGSAGTSPARGGSGLGGSSSTGGSGTGGSGTAGSGVGGSGTAGSGTAGTGTGGAPPDLCSLPPDPGPCEALFPSYYHNPETGLCEPFVYRGCDGNQNRFASVEDCQATCSGGSPNLDGCTNPQECVLVSPHCCGVCDGTLSDYTAVNTAAVSEYYSGRGCTDVLCEPCAAPDPLTSSQPYLTATCRSGECVPIDVREEGAADCESSEDCRLRAGIGCCEACSATEAEMVAISDTALLTELSCGAMLAPCLACAPIYPETFESVCEQGRCTLAVKQ
jgi:hypothetical protein